MQKSGTLEAQPDVEAVDIDMVVPKVIGPGCLRRDLPSRGGVRIWVVDMAPGSVWPHVDQHDAQGEDVYVISGTMIDGAYSFGAGSYLKFAAHSLHQPRTETGVRLFGFNLLGAMP
ncbi:cupin domain-containing protein [Pseudoxanthomonas wuyuanensis]